MGVLMRFGAQLLAASSVSLALAAGCAGTAPPPRQPTALPDVPLSTLDHGATRLPLVLAHRPALVALWATWCDACRSERAALDRLDLAIAHRGGVVVGIAVGEPTDVVREDLGRHPTAYVQLVDEPFALADALGVHTLPTVLVLDADARVVHVGGALDRASLAAFRRVLGVD
jgi:hypothetical protein